MHRNARAGTGGKIQFGGIRRRLAACRGKRNLPAAGRTENRPRRAPRLSGGGEACRRHGGSDAGSLRPGCRAAAERNRGTLFLRYRRKARCLRLAAEGCRTEEAGRSPPAGIPAAGESPGECADPEAGAGRGRLHPDHWAAVPDRTAGPLSGTELCLPAQRDFSGPAAGKVPAASAGKRPCAEAGGVNASPVRKPG